MWVTSEAQNEHNKKLELKLAKVKYALTEQHYSEGEAQENIKLLVSEDVQLVVKTLKDYFIINHPKLSSKKLHKLLSQHFENLKVNYTKIKGFICFEHIFPDHYWHNLNQTVHNIFHQELKKTIHEHVTFVKKEKRDKRSFFITVIAIFIAILGIIASLYPGELKTDIGASANQIESDGIAVYHDLFDTYLCKKGLLE